MMSVLAAGGEWKFQLKQTAEGPAVCLTKTPLLKLQVPQISFYQTLPEEFVDVKGCGFKIRVLKCLQSNQGDNGTWFVKGVCISLKA